MNQPMSTKKITYTGLFTALVFLATRFLAFPGPIPPGYINLGDSVIMVCAVLMGGKAGMFAGAVGSALADITYPGGIIFAPFTFVVKGLEGLIVGKLAYQKSPKTIVVAIVIGAMIMVTGYFVAEWVFLPLFDETFGMTFAIAELPFNGIQGVANATIGILLSLALRKKVKL